MKTYSAYKQNKTIQLLYNWQNDGSQKQKISDEDGKCPCCDEIETHMHYLKCTNNELNTAKKNALNMLKSHLQKLQTYPGIISATTRILTEGCEDTVQSMGIPRRHIDVLLLRTVQRQITIGDMLLLKE